METKGGDNRAEAPNNSTRTYDQDRERESNPFVADGALAIGTRTQHLGHKYDQSQVFNTSNVYNNFNAEGRPQGGAAVQPTFYNDMREGFRGVTGSVVRTLQGLSNTPMNLAMLGLCGILDQSPFDNDLILLVLLGVAAGMYGY